MSTHSLFDSDLFEKGLQTHYGQFSAQDGLSKIRAAAWDHFQELGLPSKHEESYRCIKLRHLYGQPFLPAAVPAIDQAKVRPHILPECEGSCLVFVNGCYQPSLSHTTNLSKRLTVSALTEATRTFGAYLNNNWHKKIKEETDPFAILNAALHREGLFLYLAPKSLVEMPVQILHVIDAGEDPFLLLPRIQLFVGAQSQIELIVNTVELSGQRYFVNQSLDAMIDDDAHLRLTQMDQRTCAAAWKFDSCRAVVKKNGSFKAVNFSEGSTTSRSDYRVILKGENGEASLNGLWMLRDKLEAHSHVVIDHQAPRCRSRQLFKGVLNDFGCSSFEGKILVRQEADKTDAFQLNNNLLLSDHANADSKPNLEIFADDVKASHGATVGQLDAEQLFYLRARGLSDEDAKNILIYGFSQEVIDLVAIPSASDYVKKRVEFFLK